MLTNRQLNRARARYKTEDWTILKEQTPMKILVPMEEVRRIVQAELQRQGYNVEFSNDMTETEGRYEDAITRVTGIAFDLMPKGDV